MNIRINNYIPISTVEGPGKRFVIWTQGCSLKCKGCANFQMWNKNDGKLYNIKDIIALINKYSEKIEGITFLGGEPLEQIKPVTEISKAVHNMGLSVLLFTGYEYSERLQDDDFMELKKYLDILIDGRFDITKLDYSRPWVGSDNQKYYFLSDRYNENILQNFKNKIEIRFDKNKSKIILNGMGNYQQAVEMLKETILC